MTGPTAVTATATATASEPGSTAGHPGAPHRLGRLDDIPVGEARTFAVGDQQIAVFRLRGDVVRAIDAVCPHAGGPIADGQADADVVICPLHLHVFDLATGESTSGAPPIGCHPVRLAPDGTIELTR
jgi:nitrite reductase (NADH) small subunit